MAIIMGSGEINSGVAEADPKIVDFVTVKEAMEEDTRRRTAAMEIRDMVQHDLDSQILLQNGGYTAWALKMGYGPVVSENSAMYRTAWYEAVEAQALGLHTAESA